MLAEVPMFVVADGMGGHAAGDVASNLAVKSLFDLVGHGPISMQDVLDALAEANSAIVDAAATDSTHRGMGTTIAGLALVSVGGTDHWMVFNVGDSRVYRLAEGEFSQLTVDHSEAQELIGAGKLTREEARHYKRRNVVTRSLGNEPREVIDSWLFPPVPGERFLICSDGLTGEVRDEVIEDHLESIADPQEAAESLLKRAIEAGGTDNITVLIVDGKREAEDSPVNEDTAPRTHHAS